ncbi:NADH-quinone oxidoreductase subunit L [Granulicella arctica]|uniref:NADH-quinone oxidoreductase subunit L n=1 Tax=Granulicella arctica TaxID=940613 RepID=A0A7Y9PFA5_9BACT|nr:NADH-quinone oxidoreductase subunit L [Granulicella arctica]NYF78108.1 NADH-quinone oxidoreductase subunit L [Granulicella arctica]
MTWIVQNLWLVPVLPITAAGIIALTKQRHRVFAASLAIGSMAISFLLSLCAFAHALSTSQGEAAKQVFNFGWFQFGSEWLKLGWILDPLTAVMLLMVTFVGLLIFVYSVGYMAHDENFTRFFCFLALFAGAMLGVIIANSLLLLFMCWEIVGLTSYLLIGFWYANPKAAAAAKKAFLVTRIGDLGFFLGMAWLYAQTGTLLFYDGGSGCLEHSALTTLVTQTTIFGITASTGIALLIFCGAAGKSGQVPLHVWLPDAMEGPTPVSALIHAATMVAAGVFLIARIYPLMSAHVASLPLLTPTLALQVITWVGAITALFGALVAVAQYDIKRILAYSTVSQLGYMMMGLGVGGVSVGMFHLITHAFFKSLLFLGAGSVIHGCSGEQDIRRMGGLRKFMPITFATYAVGMLALCGFPLFFSGFWSKDEILHAAFVWSISRMPFYMGAFGALLTAFYMTRQLCYVFAGVSRQAAISHTFLSSDTHGHNATPHESPAVMTTPLLILAAFAILLGLIGAPAWPWFQSFLEGEHATLNFAAFSNAGILPLMAASSFLVFLGLGLGWWLYGRKPIATAEQPDALGKIQPHLFSILSHAFYVDELYSATILRLNAPCSLACDWFDRWVWNGAVQIISYLVLALAWLDNFFDTYVVNASFDESCQTVSRSGQILSRLQGGRIQSYLQMIGLALIVLVVLLLWGTKA